MAKKVKIDKLDLKKRKADLEQASEQQVHIRLSEQGSQQKEAEEATEEQDWAQIKQANDEDLGPGEVTPTHSFIESVEEKFAKIKKNVSGLKMKKKAEEPLQQAVVIRSAAPVEVEEDNDFSERTETVNLRQKPSRSKTKSGRVVVEKWGPIRANDIVVFKEGDRSMVGIVEGCPVQGPLSVRRNDIGSWTVDRSRVVGRVVWKFL